MKWQIFSALLICANNLLAQQFGLPDSTKLNLETFHFLEDHVTYLVKDFEGENHQRPEMGCELSDQGSWYDIAYSGGINRFWINSLRHHTYDQVGFNTAQDVGQLSLFIQTPEGKLIDGSNGSCSVQWFSFGWKTTTIHDKLKVESMIFYTAFNTVAICTKVKNEDTIRRILIPSLLVTDRSEYDGMKGGLILGSETSNGELFWQNRRIGKSCNPVDYTDELLIGSTCGKLHSIFLPSYLRSVRGIELMRALDKKWETSLNANEGTALAMSDSFTLEPGVSHEFAFYLVAGAKISTIENAMSSVKSDFRSNSLEGIISRVERDWTNYLEVLPRLNHPNLYEKSLYYSSALALRVNHILLNYTKPAIFSRAMSSAGLSVDNGNERNNKKAVLYNASCPARGGFNLFVQSDACWNLLGYLDINPEWAIGHTVPVLDPTCIIMDPHFYWSMWELYSRIPDTRKQHDFAVMVYPLLKSTYKAWTNQIDIDHNLLCSTPNNWDDGPRADLLFREATDIEGQWNSWWNDWVKDSRDHYLEDPAASSQLAYGTVILGRFAKILRKNQDAARWKMQFKKSVNAINSLWNEKSGFWVVTYRHQLKDNVLTSSILYPIFTDVCRDTTKIRRVIETHILNKAEFNGLYPIPTVAYDSPRYYKQKPPRNNEEGGLWRGNIWLPETWIIVKGLYKYGYENEAKDIASRLIDMMSHQETWTKNIPQFRSVPCEYYDSRTGKGQNIRQFSWTSAVAMEYLLGNYQNERVLGTNAIRDREINGNVREIFDFNNGESLFRIKTVKSAFPILHMVSENDLPIQKSMKVNFNFSDPAGNFTDSNISFKVDSDHWSVMESDNGNYLKPDKEGYYHVILGTTLMLVAHSKL